MRRVLLAGLLVGAAALPVDAGDAIDPEVMAWARATVKQRLADALPAPEFPADREWLNVARPLSLGGELSGKVVVLDFWCYCCINCMHVLPDLEYLEEKYSGQAFAVVGVHSAKFTNEKATASIREAIRRYEIHHPVVNDDDFRIWTAYGARAWPTFVIVTPDGRYLGQLTGEGNREDLDALVAATLEHYGRTPGVLDTRALPVRLERTSRPAGPLAYPGKLAVDAARGRLYVADSNHNRVLALDLEGRFVCAWGNGERGLADGAPEAARFFRPQGLALHGDELWVADTENHAIRRIDLETGRVSTAAGTGRQGNLYRLLRRSPGPHPARDTALNSPWDLVHVGGRITICMAGSHQLWTLDPSAGTLTHFAGDGTERRLDAADGARAAFAQPSGITWDGRVFYVADSESSTVLRVTPKGAVETLVGGSADPKDLFTFGDEDGVGRGRRLQHPLAVLHHRGVLYVADAYNHKIKVLDPQSRRLTSRWGGGGPGAADAPARFSEPAGLAALGSTLYVADTNNHAVRAIDLESGAVTTLDLGSVPIPRRQAREGGLGGAWPALPGTVFLSSRPFRVAADAGASFTLRLELPEGWKLTAGAPSAVRVEIGETVTDAAVVAPEIEVVLPTLEAGSLAGRLRLLYYVCEEDDGACRVRSVDAPLAVEVVAGARPPVFVDRFEP